MLERRIAAVTCRPVRAILVVFLLVSASAVGCGKDSASAAAAPARGSCNNAAKGFCNEFLGAQFTADQVQLACKAQGVAHSTGACPTDKLVGTCHVYAGQPMDSMYRYYPGFPGGAAAAEKQCKDLLKGQWTKPQ